MEELDKISVIVWVQQVNNLVNSVNELKILASNKNIVINELKCSLKSLYTQRRENDIMNWIFYTEVRKEDLTSTPHEITLFWIKVNLAYN